MTLCLPSSGGSTETVSTENGKTLNTHQNISLPHPTEIENEGLFLPYADVCTCFLPGSGSEERGFRGTPYFQNIQPIAQMAVMASYCKALRIHDRR